MYQYVRSAKSSIPIYYFPARRDLNYDWIVKSSAERTVYLIGFKELCRRLDKIRRKDLPQNRLQFCILMIFSYHITGIRYS